MKILLFLTTLLNLCNRMTIWRQKKNYAIKLSIKQIILYYFYSSYYLNKRNLIFIITLCFIKVKKIIFFFFFLTFSFSPISSHFHFFFSFTPKVTNYTYTVIISEKKREELRGYMVNISYMDLPTINIWEDQFQLEPILNARSIFPQGFLSFSSYI